MTLREREEKARSNLARSSSPLVRLQGWLSRDNGLLIHVDRVSILLELNIRSFKYSENIKLLEHHSIAGFARLTGWFRGTFHLCCKEAASTVWYYGY